MSPIPVPIRSELHTGSPKWHSAMVSSVVSCQNAVEEILDKYLQANHIPFAKKSFSEKIDRCSRQAPNLFPTAACHKLRRLRNMCAHERAKSSEEKQLQILCSIDEIEALLDLPQEPDGRLSKRPFSTISIFLCERVLETLNIEPPPIILGSLFDPDDTCRELEERFLGTTRGS